MNVDGDTGVVSTDPLYNSNYINEYGMGWFPGYAINIETGERLNIMFSENSWLVSNNGRDMQLNPTSTLYDPLGMPIFGGQHYVYVMGHVDLSLSSGELVGLIGPNGSGKTTVFNVITGIYAPDAGTVALDGAPTAGLAPHRINRIGQAAKRVVGGSIKLC